MVPCKDSVKYFENEKNKQLLAILMARQMALLKTTLRKTLFLKLSPNLENQQYYSPFK